MKQASDHVIVLSRVNFGEKDRIITVLGKSYGKISLIAKSVRASKSKLAGSIELFSQINVQYVSGKGSVGTLTGARLLRHFSNISADVDRTMAAYDFLKTINTVVEEGHGSEYYEVLSEALRGLDNTKIELESCRAWFSLHVLILAGQAPSLKKDASGRQLELADNYEYDFDAHCFTPLKTGKFTKEHIKFLRVLSGSKKVPVINTDESIIKHSAQLSENILQINLSLN